MKTVTRTPARSKTPEELAAMTADAYSVNRYNSWLALVKMLQKRNYTDREVEAILRSKWTRWAADSSRNPNRGATAADLERFLDDPRNQCTRQAVRKLL